MKRGVLIVLGSVLLSLVASALLGQVMLGITPFGHAVVELRQDSSGAAQDRAERKYGNLLDATTGALRVTAFVLDPIAAIISGIFVGFWGGKRSSLLATLGIFPLAVFSALTYPWLWPGMLAAAVDVSSAAVASHVVSTIWGGISTWRAFRFRRRSAARPTGAMLRADRQASPRTLHI